MPRSRRPPKRGPQEQPQRHDEEQWKDEQPETERDEEESQQDEVEVQHLVQTDYEIQREQRIKENEAKFAALNIPFIASSLVSDAVASSKQLSKRQGTDRTNDRDDDGDYQPSDDTLESEERDGVSPENNDDDLELKEALALSLGDQPGGQETARSVKRQKIMAKVSRNVSGKRKLKKAMGQQFQFTLEEIALMFSLVDEQGMGKFSVVELERVAQLHDFTWSMQELRDMIDIFDENKDGKLDLSEFQEIFIRTGMIKPCPTAANEAE